MKKQKTEIATNTSSGAEKVEVIEKEVKSERSGNAAKTASRVSVAKKTAADELESARGEAALGSAKPEKKSENKPQSEKAKSGRNKAKAERVNAKKMNAETSGSKAEKESAAAKARVEAALKKKEEQEKRKAEREEKAKKKKELREKKAAEKKALIEKRTAEKKAQAEKRAAAKKEQAEKRAAEKEAKLRERAHKKAEKNRNKPQKKTAKKKESKNGGESKQRRENRGKGYGGWIAAVVSLGVVTLALATTVTVGAIDMKNTKDTAIAGHRSTMYELAGIMEHVDDDLDRIRISESPAQQSRILTDLLVQARLAEQDLEKLPIAAEADRNATTFINRTAQECERMLGKLRHGGTLSDEDKATLERLYQTNHAIRTELDTLMTQMTDKDFIEYMKDGAGSVAEAFDRIEKATLEENRAAFENRRAGAGIDRGIPAAKSEEKKAHIDSARAEALCLEYFSDYNVSEYQCVGETVSHSYAAYNVQGYDDKGTMLFAEISQEDGALLRFDYYEDCAEERFDLDNAEKIAEAFLEKLGYEDMTVTRFRDNGTTTDFTFLYENDDVVYYPDEVRVKVCRTRGVVTGMDATKYLAHHKERTEEPEVKVTLEEAYDKLYDGLETEAARLAVVGTARGERTAYEFLCKYGEENYFIYLDATTGEEIAIVNARNVQ